jgi:ferritin-like metal-binding protein YciE
MKLDSLGDLLHHELRDLYSVENQLVQALPKMAKAATNEKLRAAFQTRVEETKKHVEALDLIGNALERSLDAHRSKAMEGLIEETEAIINTHALDGVRDAALIRTAQRIAHYEIAGYGTARALAERLGYEKVAASLDRILDEEKEADVTLTELAEAAVNAEAQIQAGGK